MADPLQTNVQVNDIPEYLRDYRSALLNAAFGSVFTEPYLRQQFPKGQFSALAGQSPQATTAPAPSGGSTPPENTRTETPPEEQGIAAALRSSRSRLPNLLGMVYDPKTRTYIPEAYQFLTSTRMAGGGSVNDDEIEKILKSYQDLRKDMPVGLMKDLYDSQDKEILTGAVTAPGRKNPFGELIGPSQTSLYTTGSSFGSSLDRFNQAPDITPKPTSPVSTGVKTPPPPERLYPPSPAAPPSTRPPSTRPPGASAPSTPSTPGAPGSSAPGVPGLTDASAPIYSSGLAGTTQTPAGYNPAQYATDAQAQGIARLLGGSTAATNVGGPNAPPSQNLVNLGGSDVFNAGLVQQRLRSGQTPSEMTGSLQMMRDEVARSGGNTAEIDRMIQQNNRAYASGAKVSPVGMAGGGSLAQFDIGDDGKVKNYRKGGAIRRQTGGAAGPNIHGFGVAATPSIGGFQNLFAAKNPDLAKSPGVADIFNAPPVYGGQRIMQFGTTENPVEFGQYAPGVGFKASDMTLNALRGAGNLPSIFNNQGQISAGTDFGKGVGSINFATDIAGEAAATGRDFLGKTMSSPDQQSYLMSLMPGIKEMGFKGPIKIDPLMAPTLQAPMGVTAAGLKDYQMEQPLGVSGENIDILGRLGGLNAAQVQGVPQVQQFQMQGPERVTGQTRDILSVLGDVSGSKVEGVPQVQQFQMGPAERVGAERTSVDAFGRPQAEQYMSPYMDAVTDVQKREASRQAAMQKAGRSAAAVRAGAFGGSRQAIQEGMAEEALQRQIGDIEATGRQRAFENAQAQFERDRAASLASQQANVQSGLQAALANQQAGVTTGRENLGALLSTQQLGTQAGLQAALANQQAAQQAGLTKYGTRADILKSQSAQDLQAALANQQAGLMAGRENLGAQLATQQLGTQTGIQAALANQQAQQQAGLTEYGTTADILRSQSAQNLQAALANQQAGLTAGRENLAARLGTQQLGAQQALQAQLANQQAGLTAGQGNLQSALATQQLATQSGLEAAKASQSGDLATWQMQLDAAKQASAEQEAARQRGFQNRLAAMQQAQAGAAGLAGLGGTMMGIPGMAQQLELQRLAAMQQAGGAVDARTQQSLDLAYQDFINQQNAPYQQMNFLQGILGGVPTGMQVEGVQFQRPAAGGLTGLIGAGAGSLLNYLNK